MTTTSPSTTSQIRTRLHTALRSADSKTAAAIVATHPDSTALITPLSTTSYLTPLNYASLLGTPTLISALLASPIVSIDTHSITLCASHNHPKSLTLLLSSATSSTLQSSAGPALYEAAYCGSVDCVISLLRVGAPVEYRAPHDESTPLHLAAMSGSVAMLDALLRAGADITAKDASGCTAINCARRVGSSAAVARLLLAKAEREEVQLDEDVRSTPGVSPCMSDDGIISADFSHLKCTTGMMGGTARKNLNVGGAHDVEQQQPLKKHAPGPQLFTTNSPTCVARFHP